MSAKVSGYLKNKHARFALNRWLCTHNATIVFSTTGVLRHSNFRVFHPSRLFKAPLHRSGKSDDSFHELPLVYPKREAASRDAHYTALNANVNALRETH
jgi:hypothetical protein